MKKNLKPEPCPVCHGESKIRKIQDPGGIKDVDMLYYVECKSCHSRGAYGDSEEDAITKWNIREDERLIGIKGCPMCGHSGMLVRTWGPKKKNVWSVSCSRNSDFHTDFFDTPEEAIASWNGEESDA